MILLKIALRNLREHRSKTLIIGVLVALGVALMVVGNSLFESITRGLEASYVENFTGDLIVRGASEDTVSFIGGFGGAPPALEGYPELAARIDAMEGVRASAPLLSGSASLNAGDELLTVVFLWGIEPSSYFALFPGSFTVDEGRRLRDGERGIMLPRAVVDDVAEEEGVELRVGDTVLLSGQNDITGTKIREVPIRGIGAFDDTNELLANLSLVDAGTLRALTGLTAVRAEAATAVPDFETDEDALFGGSVVREADASEAAAPDYDRILGDTSVRDRFLATDDDAWHFLLLDVADAGAVDGVTAEVARYGGEEIVVEGWRWGAGFVAGIAYAIRNILNGVILAVAIVAVIIITNTLVISVTERTAEIGTIRAIGGQRGFVRRMIAAEVLTVTLLFGFVGMAVGALAVGVLHLVGLPPANIFLEVLFGGSELRPTLSVGALLLSVAAVAVVGVVASLYPTSVALRVPPVRAMEGP